MYNREYRKLHREKDLASTLGIHGLIESDDGGASFWGSVERPIYNRFELLNSIEHSLSDTEAKKDDDCENELPQDGQERNKLEKQDSTNSKDSLKQKKKKKKKLKNQKSTIENLNVFKDEVEASLHIVNKMLGEPVASADSDSHKHGSKRTVHEKSILSIDLRNLNADNEMKKIFGFQVVQNEENIRRFKKRTHGQLTVLVSEKNWPEFKKTGLSMRLTETIEGVHYFVFQRSKEYKCIQLQFLEAVESSNPNNITDLLNDHPYHTDALIQFSDTCRMRDDVQKAAQLIEQAIFYMDRCRHPLFNVATGRCRLDYRIDENRAFFIALFKHLVYIGQRGCNRTSLELCKLILSLDPVDDPLGIIFMIDYYAIRSGQYEYLIKFYYEWDPRENLFMLPNFVFSVALATYLLAIEKDEPTYEANVKLQDALLMFPGFLLPMLNRCNVEPDEAVQTHPFFTRSNDPPRLVQLISLYISRTHSLWKAPDIIQWLEKQVHVVISIYECSESSLEWEGIKNFRFGMTRPNFFRHIFLSNVADPSVLLPQGMPRPIFGFDPLPPIDAIPSRLFYYLDRRMIPIDHDEQFFSRLFNLLPIGMHAFLDSLEQM